MQSMSTPEDVQSAAAEILADLSEDRREAFALRLDRWWGDLLDGLAVVYPDPGAVARRLVDLAARAYAARPDDLHRLDQRRLLAPDWLQQPRDVRLRLLHGAVRRRPGRDRRAASTTSRTSASPTST